MTNRPDMLEEESQPVSEPSSSPPADALKMINGMVQDDAHILDIVHSAPALLYSYKMNHVTGVSSFPYCSEYCQTLLGVPAEAVMKDPAAMVNLVHPDDVPVFTSAVVKSMSDLSLFDETLRMKHATKGNYMNLLDRSYPYHEQELNPATGDYETVTIWKGFIIEKPHDSLVDKLKTTSTNCSSNPEEEEEEDLHMSVLMDSPLIPFFALNSTTGTILKWNQVMAEATGFTAKEVVNKDAATVFGCKATTDATTFLDKLLENPKYKCQLTSKSGNEVHLILSASTKPKHNSYNSSTVHVLCQDVTQLHQVTAQRNEATKLAESERSLTEWLSHEIRNPLSVVMEAAQTLEAQQQDDPPKNINKNSSILGGSYLQLIRHSITYVVDILTNMLDLNKLAEGKIVLRPETCRIQQDILLPTQQMMGLCGKIPILIESTNDEVELFIDKLRLKQVFANLISNALKYTSQGTIRIQVHPTTDSFLTVTVSDSGIGIQPSQYQHLFSRYEQLGSSVNGAGIGLCLCKNLLTAMGGDIFLNKDYRSGLAGFPGAQFVVRLPCTKRPAPPAFDALHAALLSTASAVSSGKTAKQAQQQQTTTPAAPTLQVSPKAHLKGAFRILVVDDELVGQKLLVRRFQRIFPAATIDSSPSGEQAVEMAKRCSTTSAPYDLITMDHYMKVSEMTGAETIQELRRLDVDALIVGISGNAMRDQHMQAGADGFFQKPLPATNVVVQDLYGKLPPPAQWRVLLVDDAEVNLQLMERKLRQVAVPHGSSNIAAAAASTRWEIIKCTVASRAKTLLEEQSFDLIVLDQTLQGDTMTGIELGQFGRQTANHKDAIFILNSGSTVDSLPTWFDLAWSKPLPSVSEMRQDLFRQVLSSPTTAPPSA